MKFHAQNFIAYLCKGCISMQGDGWAWATQRIWLQSFYNIQYSIIRVVILSHRLMIINQSPTNDYKHHKYQNRKCNQILQMSKAKGKQKKSDNSSSLQTLIQQQKREILEQAFTIKKLQDRISRMTEQNFEIVNTRDEIQKKYENKIDNQRVFLDNHEDTIQKLNQKTHSLELNKLELESIIKNQQRQLEFSEEIRAREMEEYRKLVSSEMGILQSQLKQYNNYMGERDSLYKQRNKLKQNLKEEKELKMRELADKQRQKVQQTDKLKDEMLMKIRDMRTNLLSLKKEQLSTTTRLAVLQNHQLTSELEFQSKQTEKLIFQNQNLQKKLANMQKDVQIHKQVEEELAKRSHISRGIIKKLTNKIGELQEEIKKMKQNQQAKKVSILDEAEATKQESIICILDKTLEEKEKKFVKLRNDYQVMENENKNYRMKFKEFQKRSYELSLMLLRFYEDVLGGKIDIKGSENGEEYLYDIKALKKLPVEEWKTEDCKLIVTVLLNQLKPNINRFNLGIPTINRSRVLMINDDEGQVKLPAISGFADHSLLKKDLRDIPLSLAPKFVGSNLREWGRTVHSNSVSNLSKKLRHEK